MHKPRRFELFLLAAGLCLPAALWSQTSIRSVQVVGGKSSAIEIEIEASDRLVPQTRVLANPDRLVVDFPNTVPSNKVRSQSVDRGEVKDVRVGLFQSRPPVTRVVLDLKTPQSFQVFPSGRTVMIKVTGNAPAVASNPAPTEVDDFPPVTRPGLTNASFTAQPEAPKLEVTFRGGLLSIKANKASLSEVMFAVRQKTGAEIAVAGGAEQEQVAADIGPAPAAEAIASLLNGSTFNYLIVSSPDKVGGLDRVILTPRGQEMTTALQPLPMPAQNNDDQSDDEAARAQLQMETTPPPAVPVPPPGQQLPPPPNNPPEAVQGNDNTPD